MPLSRRERNESFVSDATPLAPDLNASHFPDCYSALGVRMCSTRKEVYVELRGSITCAGAGCAEAGAADPNGSFFCGQHIVDSVLPDSPGSQDEVRKLRWGRSFRKEHRGLISTV